MCLRSNRGNTEPYTLSRPRSIPHVLSSWPPLPVPRCNETMTEGDWGTLLVLSQLLLKMLFKWLLQLILSVLVEMRHEQQDSGSTAASANGVGLAALPPTRFLGFALALLDRFRRLVAFWQRLWSACSGESGGRACKRVLGGFSEKMGRLQACRGPPDMTREDEPLFPRFQLSKIAYARS